MCGMGDGLALLNNPKITLISNKTCKHKTDSTVMSQTIKGQSEYFSKHNLCF